MGKTNTLLTVLFLLFVHALAFKAQAADVVVDGSRYYYLRVTDTEYLGVDSKRTDSLVINTNKDDAHYLWSFTKQVTAGGTVYAVKNKIGTILAFDEPTGPLVPTENKKEITAVVKPNGTYSLWNLDLTHSTGSGFYVVLNSGAKSFLASRNFNNKERVVTFLVDDDPSADGFLTALVIEPTSSYLTATDLNKKLGAGFKLFFYYDGKEVNPGFPLADVLFEAEGVGTSTTDVRLKAKAIPAKNGKSSYAFVDTTTYSSNLPADGSRLLLKVDTIGEALKDNKTAVFNFEVNPSFPDGLVNVYVNGYYELKTGGLYTYHEGQVPVQIDQVTAGTTSYILTTGKAGDKANAKTTVKFDGTSSTTLLSKKQVYSVKFLNGDSEKGKYWGVDLTGNVKFYEAVPTHFPEVQFVYNGAVLSNRVNKDIKTGALYDVEGSSNVYTDGTDTLEVRPITDVDLKKATLGFAYFEPDFLESYGLQISYTSGTLVGFSVTVVDSALTAKGEDAKLFRLEPANGLAVYAEAINDSVAALKRQAYYLKSNRKNEYVYINEKGKAVLTAKEGLKTAFYFQALYEADNYIWVSKPGETKINVNSGTSFLEEVPFNLDNNPFKFVSKLPVTYKLDAARQHFTFQMPDGNYLVRDSVYKAGVSSEGKPAIVLPQQLKSKVFTSEDFVFWVDTAVGVGRKPLSPSYYIVKYAVAPINEPAKLSGVFLHVIDSAHTDKYTYNNYNLLDFVSAERSVAGDSILLYPDRAAHFKADSIGFTGKTDAIKEYRFRFRATDVADEYNIETETGNKGEPGYLKVINGVLVVAPDESPASFKLAKVQAPVANEELKPVSIYIRGGVGSVTIQNAAGKNVSIVNVLGQALVKRALRSDYETINVSRGIVIVAIEGEIAVKAVVK